MAKAIMIQGTMSNAGKSLLAAALCRIFRQDGYRVAPFKSQNMALNSYVTREGLEMGRAQVVQAQAAGIEPSVRMNPILLKPTGDSVSQVIVNGEVRGSYSAKDYFAMKKSLIPDIRRAYESLASENDIIVIEGAGSPAEINLRECDIVNMGMARIAEAPVLLVGDIDRGGVFAQLYGTVTLLEKDERRYLKGLVINKFRGDRSILEPGLRQLEDLTGKPVLGVIPYLHVDIDDEDSLSGRLSGEWQPHPSGSGMTGDSACEEPDGAAHSAGRRASCQIRAGSVPAAVDIAVLRLPRLSNFTDFDALQRIGGVSVRYVGSVREFGRPDLVILPGTKNTIGDLIWLRENGLEVCVKRAAAAGTPVIGICGGYQMLGETLSDPDGIETGRRGGDAGGDISSAASSGSAASGNGTVGRTAAGSSAGETASGNTACGAFVRGIGLLPADTVFTERKTRTQVHGIIRNPGNAFPALRGQTIDGYEIHMGITTVRPGCGAAPLARIDAETGDREIRKDDGCVKGNVCGTYVHGVFDCGDTAQRVAFALAERKGVRLTETAEDPLKYRERQYDLLADAVRTNLDMDAVYRILEEGVAGF